MPTQWTTSPTVTSAWASSDDIDGKPTIDQAIAMTAVCQSLWLHFTVIVRGTDFGSFRPTMGHAANYLYLLTGELPKDEHVQGLNSYLVLLADHGMNASTFTARIVASTELDIVSSLVAALGALKGPLHGGAPSKVQDMLPWPDRER